MQHIIRNIADIVFFPLYLISYLIPRQNDLWVFGAWQGYRFSDNAQYLYKYILENEKKIRPIWLTRNKEIIKLVNDIGGDAYLVNSFKGIWYAFRASITVINEGLQDVNTFGILGSKKVQLWHGFPFKKIGIDARNHFFTQQSMRIQQIRKLRDINIFHKWVKRKNQWDIIVASSELTQKALASAFGAPLSKVKVTSDPRCDVILSKDIRRPDAISQIINNQKTKKIILYAPTFRDGNYNYFEGLDIKKLENVLEETDTVFLVKLHFVHREGWINGSESPQSDRIYFLEDDLFMDVNKILPYVDVLITDYSSIFFDYLLLDRPMIFAPFDYNSYLEERGFYVDYYEMTPGHKCKNWEEIIRELENIIIHNRDGFASNRKTIKNLYHSYTDTFACQRVTAVAKELLQ